MSTLKELSETYVAKKQAYHVTRDRIEAQMERLKNRSSKLHHPSWMDEIIKPIASQIAALYPDRDMEILGPFGICAETSIHLYKKGLTEEQKFSEEGNCISVTLIHGDLDRGEIKIRDYTKDTGEFRDNTLGAINGMNHPSIPVETIEDIVRHIS